MYRKKTIPDNQREDEGIKLVSIKESDNMAESKEPTKLLGVVNKRRGRVSVSRFPSLSSWCAVIYISVLLACNDVLSFIAD